MRIIPIILTIFFFSCSTLKYINPNDNRSTLMQTSLSSLNGDYEILSVDTSRTTLDFALTFKKYRRFDIKSNYKVSLKAIDNQHIETSIFKNDTLLKTKVLKGKIENNYFCFNIKKLSPFYFIFNVFGNKKTRIGKLESGDLLVDCRHFQVATLVIIPLTGGRDEEYDMVFRRKTASR